MGTLKAAASIENAVRKPADMQLSDAHRKRRFVFFGLVASPLVASSVAVVDRLVEQVAAEKRRARAPAVIQNEQRARLFCPQTATERSSELSARFGEKYLLLSQKCRAKNWRVQTSCAPPQASFILS